MVRFTELTAARRASVAKNRNQNRQASGGMILARFHRLLDGSTEWGIITVDGGPEIQVPMSPGNYFAGALVSVLVDDAGRPIRVLSVRSEPEEGVEGVDVDGVERIPALPGMMPRELTAAEAKAIRETVDGLADARQKIAEAEDILDEWDETRLPALELDLASNRDAIATARDDLDAAFPSGPFNVGSEIASSASATLTAAALDAQDKANQAASDAQQAAIAHAAGEISDAELRAAQDAASKADAARDAAISAANSHADGVASAAQQAAVTAAQSYADQKKTEAITAAATDAKSKADAAQAAAIAAAEEHADLVAQGASQAAIDAAALDAQAKADAAETAAKTHANTQAAAAELAAKTHATNEAARVKQEALTEAATDAQTKATAAADAAQQAAEAYALAQAEGLSGQALADAKADAQTKADAARDAAIAAAETYADARKNEAIDAAALTAQTKADVAKQAAIDAAKADLNALEVGGRNLYQESGGKYLSTRWAAYNPTLVEEDGRTALAYNSSNNIIHTGGRGAPTIAVGETITFSFWAKGSRPMSLGRVYMGSGSGNGNFLSGAPVTEEWQFYSLTHTVTSGLNVAVHMYPTIRNEDDTYATFYLTDMKLERGSKSTDWSPAPEDVDAGIAGAQSTADTAQATADQAVTNASNAHARADAAMTTADGKNTVTYDDVSSYPGPPPDNNPDRAIFDMHRNRAFQTFTSNGITYQKGDVLAEWMWSGTAWVPVHMGDGMLRSLDVGKLTAGTGNLQTAVIQVLTAQLARLIEVDADKIVTGTISGDVLDFQTIWAGVANLGRIITKELIANGAVTAEKLNVVYTDSSSGYGFSLQPEGLTITNQDGVPVIVLRADMQNSFGVMDADGKYLASIDQQGNITGVTVSVDEELYYQGTELTEVLDQHPRGVISHSTGRGNGSAVPGTDEGRIGAVTFRTPPDARMVEVRFRGYIASGSARDVDMWIRQSAGNSVKPTNSSKQFWRLSSNGYAPVEVSALMRTDTDGWGWDPDTTITVGLFAKAVRTGESLTFHQNGGNEMTVTDMGPAIDVQQHTPWVPSTGGGTGGGNETAPGKRDYTYERKASWQQSYYLNTNVKYPLKSNGVDVGNKRSYQGYYLSQNGYLKSLIGFPSMISTLSGADITRVRLRLKNGYAGASGGVTAVIGLHGYTSTPNTWGHSAGDIVRVHHTPGSTRTVDIPRAYWAGIKSGTYRGVSLYIADTSINYYGWWDGLQTEFIIDYEK